MNKKINSNSKLVDIIAHPSFNGFGNYIFPNFLRINQEMTISDTFSLLPYHSNIFHADVVNTINDMIHLVKDGKLYFYTIYNQDEIKQDKRKKDVGLFFFKGGRNSPFALISPGGGFSYVGSIHEGFPYAIELSSKGFNSFVLIYRTGGANIACEDLAKAIEFIFENKAMLEVDTNDYSLWGSSAGARMAANIGSYGTLAFGSISLPRPSTIIMAYTGHSNYTKDDPATFVVVGENDWIANPNIMERRINALKKSGIDTEFHKYQNLSHGFGLGTRTIADGWIHDAIRFWNKHINQR